MFLRFSRFGISGLALVALVPAFADDRAVGPEVVITATRVATPIDQVLAPVIVIDRDTIDRSAATDVPDLLRFHAGLDLGRNGGPGQTTAVFIRGAESNHTLVLVDGVRINPGTIGLAALQDIPPEMVERIEVVKGPRSALWGTDAIGGVINIVTRRGSRDGWTAEAGYGDYDTRKASLNGGFGLGPRADLDFGVSWIDSAGFPTRTLDHTDRGFDNLSANAQVRANVGQAEVALRYWRAGGTTQYSDYSLIPVDQDFATATTSAEVSFPVTTRGQARLTVSHLDDRIDQNQSQFGLPLDYLHTSRDTADAQFDWNATKAQALGAGMMVSSEKASSTSYGEVFHADTNSLNLYVQDRIAVGPHQATLALGYTDHETAGSELTWNAEYGYALNAQTRVYGLAGTGFRAPDATDRYGFGGNRDLKPERSSNYEIGVRHALGTGQSVSLSAFRNEIDDLIEFVTLSYDPFMGENRNVARARIEGVEAAWTYAANGWQARVEAIYQDPRNLGDDTQLLRRAHQSLTVSLARTLGPVVLGLDVLATGDRKDFGFPSPVTLDGYVLANLTAQWQVTRALALVGRVENLSNAQYELASTFNTPDRGVYVTLRYTPGRGK
jgi:vitamin B12 transporter